MTKAPAIDAEQFGAALDALTTTNAMLFMMLASQVQTDAALGLLDRLAAADASDPLHEIRAFVAESTATTMRKLAAMNEASRHADGANKTSPN